jgi:hypothetical protein
MAGSLQNLDTVGYKRNGLRKEGLQSHIIIPEKNLPFFTFYTKGDKLVEAVIRHLPGNIHTEDITVDIQELGYNVFSAKQMTAKRPNPESLEIIF